MSLHPQPHPLCDTVLGSAGEETENYLLIRHLYRTEFSHTSGIIVACNVKTLCSGLRSSTDVVGTGWPFCCRDNDISHQHESQLFFLTCVPSGSSGSTLESTWTGAVGTGCFRFHRGGGRHVSSRGSGGRLCSEGLALFSHVSLVVLQTEHLVTFKY